MNMIKEQIRELNQNYNDLGDDLFLLEAVIIAAEGENDFPQEYVISSLKRMQECINQHTEDIRFLAGLLHEEASPRREDPKRYGRVFRKHPERDARQRKLHPQSGSDRTDHRTSAKTNSPVIRCHAARDAQGILKP